ncbi:unnamed protein product, partial [Symbiodinium pilosum]
MVRAIFFLQVAVWLMADHVGAMSTTLPESCRDEASCELPLTHAGDEMSALQAEVRPAWDAEK